MDDDSKSKKKFPKPRINGFGQLKKFFELVALINDEKKDRNKFKHSAIALYVYLLTINNKLMWKEWFSISLIEIMTTTKMNEKTYYSAIKSLEKYNFIIRTKGNRDQASMIKLVDLLTVNITDIQAVNFTGNRELIRQSIGNSSGNDRGTFNNSKLINDKTNKRVNEKKTTPNLENLNFENEKRISSDQELKECFSQNWKDETCLRNGYENEKFGEHVESWINKKIKTGDYKYPAGKLQAYCISDFEKLPAGKVKRTSTISDDIARLAKILPEQEKEEKKITENPPPPPQKVMNPQKVAEWIQWACETSSRRNFDEEIFTKHVHDWILERNNIDETYDASPELKRICLLAYTTTTAPAHENTLMEKRNPLQIIYGSKPEEAPVINVDSTNEPEKEETEVPDYILASKR